MAKKQSIEKQENPKTRTFSKGGKISHINESSDGFGGTGPTPARRDNK